MPAKIKTHHTGYDRYNRTWIKRLGESPYVTSEYPLTYPDIELGQFQIENETDSPITLDVKTLKNPDVWVSKKIPAYTVCDLLCVAVRPSGGTGTFSSGIVVG